MKITKNAVASLAYTLTNDDGEIIDSSDADAPLAYIHGIGSLIPGLEKELEGKLAGDELTVHVAPADAYGERNDEMIHPVPRSQMPPDAELEIGMQLQAESEHGVHIVTVVALEGDTVMLDANHPLAGVALNFEVTVVDVRDATAEELEHGHVHGPDGHDH